ERMEAASTSLGGAAPASGREGVAAAAPADARGGAPQRPMLPPEITQLFAPAIRPAQSVIYRPSVLAEVSVRYTSAKHGVDETRTIGVLVPLAEGAVPFSTQAAQPVDLTVDILDTEGLAAASFANLPAEAAQPR